MNREMASAYATTRRLIGKKRPPKTTEWSYIPRRVKTMVRSDDGIPHSTTMLSVDKRTELPFTPSERNSLPHSQRDVHGLVIARSVMSGNPQSCEVTQTGWVCKYDASELNAPSLMHRIGSPKRLPSRGAVMVKIVMFPRVVRKTRHVGPILDVMYGDGYVHEYLSRHLADEGMVPKLYVAGVHRSGYFVCIMEYIDGVPLIERYFDARGRFVATTLDATTRARELSAVVKRLLKLGVMHHDLHGGNVVVRNRKNDKVCVIDFGLASFIKLPPWFHRTLDTSPDIDILSPSFIKRYHSNLTPLANGHLMAKGPFKFYYPMIGTVAYLRSIGNK